MPQSTKVRLRVHPAREFATTRWTVIAQAGGAQNAEARAALEKLCQIYWYPLYAYLRREGSSAEDAEDLTQGFLVSLLERNDFARTTPEKGRFRSFLLASLKHYTSKQRARGRALKRGGGAAHFSLDAETAETRYQNEPAHTLSPDRLYERRWALSLLENAFNDLRAEYAGGKARIFEALSPTLTGEKLALPYEALAKQLETTEGNVKALAHRLRRRYRELLRERIRETVSEEKEVEEELQHLFAALGG